MSAADDMTATLPWSEDGMCVIDSDRIPVVVPVVADSRAPWAIETRLRIVRDVNGAQIVRDLHREHGPTGNGIHICLECKNNWPCRTIKALT